jgi:hypothetical protein
MGVCFKLGAGLGQGWTYYSDSSGEDGDGMTDLETLSVGFGVLGWLQLTADFSHTLTRMDGDWMATHTLGLGPTAYIRSWSAWAFAGPVYGVASTREEQGCEDGVDADPVLGVRFAAGRDWWLSDSIAVGTGLVVQHVWIPEDEDTQLTGGVFCAGAQFTVTLAPWGD